MLVGGEAWCEGMIFKCKNDQGAMIYQKSPCSGGSETLDSWQQPKEKKADIEQVDGSKNETEVNGSGDMVLKLKQNTGGHYATEGSIDGKSLIFVVDTGAAYVSLPEFIAHEAQIYCDNTIKMNTANGQADACTAKVKKLQFGPFYVEEVAAVIAPNLSQPLLGMNVLQLFKIDQNEGEMKISYEKKDKKTKDGS
jgi:clan AA aspartic protease (TIGR02281 family)